VSGARGLIGVITNNRHEVFQRSVIRGVDEAASVRGYRVVVDSIAEDAANPRPVALDLGAMSGLLIIANVLPDEHLRALHEAGRPMTLISHHVPGLSIPAVITDNRRGMGLLARAMIEQWGCRRIVHIQGDMRQSDAIERDQAVQRELMRAHLAVEPDCVLEGRFEPARAWRLMAELLTRRRDFDGVLAADFQMALAALRALREAGVRVPDDVQVAGFGDGEEAAGAGLTTVAADVYEQGRRGARQLIGQMEGLRMRGTTVLNTSLIPRETTRPVGAEEAL
jgi:LacI family transcriptional regulator